MKTQLAICDLARMYKGRTCMAGYTGRQACIRSVLPGPGILETAICQDGLVIIYPFSIIELALLTPLVNLPIQKIGFSTSKVFVIYATSNYGRNCWIGRSRKHGVNYAGKHLQRMCNDYNWGI